MNLHIGFSWVGLLVFALPLLINIAYVLFPPSGEVPPPSAVPRLLEAVEKASRIAYALALTLLVSDRAPDVRSPWFFAAALFLLLYYITWIRYFAGGRRVALLGRPLLFVPMPLAVFPVLCYLCAALWLQNPVAAALMVLFGAVHITVSALSFRHPKQGEEP